MGGTEWRCSYMGSGNTVAPRANAFLETTSSSTVDRNIDVRFRSLQVRAGATWGDMSANVDVVAPNYTVDRPTTQKIDCYKAPLD
jgi:hypothetical protein